MPHCRPIYGGTQIQIGGTLLHWTQIEMGFMTLCKIEKGRVNVGLSYSRGLLKSDIDFLSSMGYNVSVQLPVVDALLIGDVDASDVWNPIQRRRRHG